MVGISRVLLVATAAAGAPSPTSAQTMAAAARTEVSGSVLLRPARLTIERLSLVVALDRLSETSGVRLVFSPTLLGEAPPIVSCACRTVPLAAALDRLLTGSGLGYEVVDGYVVIVPGSAESPDDQEMLRIEPQVINVLKLARWSGSAPSAPRLTVDLQAGAVAGVVVNERSVPLPSARVAIEAINRVVTTDIRGRFRLDNLSGANVTLRVSAIGFRPATVTARVGDEQVSIQLTPSIVELNDVVVTGTAGGEERRALGHSVSKIHAAEIQAISPTPDLSTLLNGRAPGLVYLPSQGNVGAGGRIRIRGQSSISLSNNPLLYIDGVRADGSSGRGFGNASTSRLNDLDPSTIESIEVIKGPAAATLYGTEASNGVIQIITKKGTQGRAQLSMTATQGANWIMDPEGKYDKTVSYFRRPDGSIGTFNLVRFESDSGRPIFRTGHVQRYALEAAGGAQAVQYFVSGSYDNEDGVVDPNNLIRWSGRANIQGTIGDKLTVSATGGYASSRINVPPTELLRGPNSPVPATIGTPNRGFLLAPPEALRASLFQIEDLSRYSAGIQFNYQPWKWLAQRLNVGVDEVNEAAETLRPRLPASLIPFFGATAAMGSKSIGKRELTTTTLDYSGTATWNPVRRIGTKTSVGAQYYRSYSKTASLSGTGFPAPGITTISSAATRTASETFVENITIGGYIQEQISLNDRLFLTAALRADDNSAFGQDFNVVIYPKFSASWVVSDEPFWPSGLLPTFRLRAAYGQSGRQPDQFSAVRSYAPVPAAGGLAGIRPSVVGNPLLGPEKGDEIEAGFEAGLLDDRLGIDFTYYDKRTKDAILNRPISPSLGFPGSQPVNIGEVMNRGWELQLRGAPLASQNMRLDLVFGLSRNTNKILDMGGLPATGAGGTANQQHREGFPIAGFFERVVVSAEIGPNGQPTNMMCDSGRDGGFQGGPPVPCAGAPRVYFGQPLPKYEGSVNATAQFFRRLTVSGLLDFKTGQSVFSSDLAIQCQILFLCLPNVDPSTDPIAAGEMALAIFGPYQTPKVSYAKFRSLSASYRMPESWGRRLGAPGGVFLTVSARNLATFTNYKRGVDPEVVTESPAFYFQAFNQVPTPFEFITSLRLTF